jgi:hypothetical protein
MPALVAQPRQEVPRPARVHLDLEVVVSWSINVRDGREEIAGAIDAAEESPRQETDRGRAHVAAAKQASKDLVQALGGDGDVIAHMSGHSEEDTDAGVSNIAIQVYEAATP